MADRLATPEEVVRFRQNAGEGRYGDPVILCNTIDDLREQLREAAGYMRDAQDIAGDRFDQLREKDEQIRRLTDALRDAYVAGFVTGGVEASANPEAGEANWQSVVEGYWLAYKGALAEMGGER